MKKSILILPGLIFALTSCQLPNFPGFEPPTKPEENENVPEVEKTETYSEVITTSEISTTPNKPIEIINVEITNKDKLTQEWHVNEADRLVELKFSKILNANNEIANGRLIIISDNTNVIVTNGLYISAVNEGSAVVSVYYKNEFKDSVLINVLPELGEPDLIKSSIAEIKNGQDSTAMNRYFNDVYVRGFKNYAETSDKYGNLYVDDNNTEDKDDDLLLYGSGASMHALQYNPDSKTYNYANQRDFLTNIFTRNIKIGDKLNTVMIRKDWKTTVEGMAVIRGINDKIIPNRFMSISEILDLKKIQTTFAIETQGQIESFINGNGTQYGNLKIKDPNDPSKILEVFGLNQSNNCFRVDETTGDLIYVNQKDFLTGETTKNLKVGDMISITGILSKFKDRMQICGFVNAPSINFDKKQYNIPVGQTDDVKISLKYIDGEISYSSLNPEIATIDDAGHIIAHKLGETTITAKCGNAIDNAKVVVYDPIAQPPFITSELVDIINADFDGKAKVAYTTRVKVKAFTDKNVVVEKPIKYGNMIVSDLNDENEFNVYGASVSLDALHWDDFNGNFYYINPRNFDVDPLSSTIKVGDTLDIIAIRNDHSDSVGITTKQMAIVIRSINP